MHTLLKKKASLRYRKRFINNIISKNLIQFKTQNDNEKPTSMQEFKIEINEDETLISYRDFKDYINRPKNKNSELYKNLSNYVKEIFIALKILY